MSVASLAPGSKSIPSAVQAAIHYVRHGIGVLKQNPWVYVQLVALFGAFAVSAAVLTLSETGESAGISIATFLLDAVASAVAPAVVIAAVSAGFHGQRLGLVKSLGNGLFWLPRYLWTNLHTSVIFWVPMGGLIALSKWHTGTFAYEGTAATAVAVMWGGAIAVAGLYLHSRTLIAPCLAIHGNLPGTLATIESWRLSGRHFGKVLTTMVAASTPALLVIVLALGLLMAVFGGVAGTSETLMAILPFVVTGAIQLVRQLLYAASFGLYEDLWRDEQIRRATDGEPAIPAPAIVLLRISRAIPTTAGRLVGRQAEWTL